MNGHTQAIIQRMCCVEVDNLADRVDFSPVKLLLAVDPLKIYEVRETIRNFLSNNDDGIAYALKKLNVVSL